MYSSTPLVTTHKKPEKRSTFHIQDSKPHQDTDRIQRLHEGILQNEQDPQENIQRYTQLCGELFQGLWATYNTVENGTLRTIGQWNAPSHYRLKRSIDGIICTDVIHKNSDTPLLIRNLPQTGYAETDSSIQKYQLLTYMGLAVKTVLTCFGCLSVVFQHDYVPRKTDLHILGVLTEAIKMEEERRLAEGSRTQAYDDPGNIARNLPPAVLIFNRNLQLSSTNHVAEHLLGIDNLSTNSYNMAELFPADTVNRISLMSHAPIYSAEVGYWKQEKEFCMRARNYRYRLIQIPDLTNQTYRIRMVLWEVTQEKRLKSSIDRRDHVLSETSSYFGR